LGARPSATNRDQLRRDTPTIAAAVLALTISTTHVDSTGGAPAASLNADLVTLLSIVNTSP
jgi:hypothetical protein